MSTVMNSARMIDTKMIECRKTQYYTLDLTLTALELLAGLVFVVRVT